MVGASIQESVESKEVDVCVVVGEPTRLVGVSVRGERSGRARGVVVFGVIADGLDVLRVRLRVVILEGTGIRER